MSSEPEIALVLSAEEWVDALHRHCADHGGARVRCLVLDPAVALDEDFDVLVTSDRWPALTRPFVDALHLRGRRVLVVGDVERGADLAARLGVDRIVAATSSPSDQVEAAIAIAPPRRSTESRADFAPAVTAAPTGDDPVTECPRRALVAVGGPWGAGSTEIAVGLAARLVRHGSRPVVVDADTLTPSLAVRLGLPMEPNLCTAVDAVAFGLGAVPGALFDLGDDWPVVLVGAPNRRAAAALSGRDVAAVAEVLARRFAPVIVDVSAGGTEPLGHDVGVEVVTRSGVVLAVGTANPMGLVRLTEWIAALRALAPAAVVHAVVNRAPSGRVRRAELAQELHRAARLSGLTFLPTDPRVDEAVWSASLVDRGPFARALDALCRAATDLLEVVPRAPATSGRTRVA